MMLHQSDSETSSVIGADFAPSPFEHPSSLSLTGISKPSDRLSHNSTPVMFDTTNMVIPLCITSTCTSPHTLQRHTSPAKSLRLLDSSPQSKVRLTTYHITPCPYLLQEVTDLKRALKKSRTDLFQTQQSLKVSICSLIYLCLTPGFPDH